MGSKGDEMVQATGSGDSPGKETAFWGTKFLILVTGASGGLGRGIAVSFAEHVADGSLLVITGRNTAGLEETKRMIVSLGRGVGVSVATCDHSKALFRDYEDLLERASAQLPDPDRVVLVHNAASIESYSDRVISYDSEKKIGDYYRLNLTSVMTLTSAFLRHYSSDSGPMRTIVNVASTAEIEAIQGLGLYCTGQAARAMYMRVVALENPSVTVLCYNPGPVDTAMLRQMQGGSEDCVTRYENVFKDGKVMTPEISANALVRILEDRKFKSGARVSFSPDLLKVGSTSGSD
ncbi:sepiapterin reductase [Ixodes scapularis]|uniref:sepiapterin reductase n=1 Tax=Ixodes scapularis TaxID=6945 RepID=UPI001A9E850E|nr:sepiapterin reductase [Ixodes scapularis]